MANVPDVQEARITDDLTRCVEEIVVRTLVPISNEQFTMPPHFLHLSEFMPVHFDIHDTLLYKYASITLSCTTRLPSKYLRQTRSSIRPSNNCEAGQGFKMFLLIKKK